MFIYPGGGIIPGGGPKVPEALPREKVWRSPGGGMFPCSGIGPGRKLGFIPREGLGIPGGGARGLGPLP